MTTVRIQNGLGQKKPDSDTSDKKTDSDSRDGLFFSYKEQPKSLVVCFFHSAMSVPLPQLLTRNEQLTVPNKFGNHEENILHAIKEKIGKLLKEENKGKNLIFICDVNLGFSDSNFPSFLLNNDLDNMYPDRGVFKILVSGTDTVVEDAKKLFSGNEERVWIGEKKVATFLATIRGFEENALKLSARKSPEADAFPIGGAIDDDVAIGDVAIGDDSVRNSKMMKG